MGGACVDLFADYRLPKESVVKESVVKESVVGTDGIPR